LSVAPYRTPGQQAAVRRFLAEKRIRGTVGEQAEALTDEWSAPVRAFFDDPELQVVALKGRRAGATRAGVRHLLRRLVTTPGARLLYIIDTREEARRLIWYGNRQDGILPLAMQLGWVQSGFIKLTEGALTARIPSTDSWLYIFGADDEAGVRKALGGAFHEAWWDEAQKIPPKLAPLIREVFIPTLLDFNGRFRMSGTPVRQMAGLFYEITQPSVDARPPGWKFHHFNLLDNPYFGADRDERWRRGIEQLARRLGVATDAPIILREGLGIWTAEDAHFIYAVHRVDRKKLLYAPARVREDGFFDLDAALEDLPGDWHEYIFALGCDIGWDDPFALVLWAWHPHDPTLYEVVSWQHQHMDDDEQAGAIRHVLDRVHCSVVTADASGPAKPSVKGWSKKFVERYRIPVLEAEKSNKRGAIRLFNNDLINNRMKLREGGQLAADMHVLQWSPVVDGRGNEVEAAGHHKYTHAPDAGLYGHRMSYAYRGVPLPPALERGTPEALAREELELEEANYDDG
jgi:hypothetical protein